MEGQCLCSICFDNLFTAEETNSIYTTTCGHIFHHRCITQWLKSSNSCPQCRTKDVQKSLIKLNLHVEAAPSRSGVLRRSTRFNSPTALRVGRQARSNTVLSAIEPIPTNVTNTEREIMLLRREINELKLKLKEERERSAIIRSDLRIIDIINLEAQENSIIDLSNRSDVDIVDLS